MADSGCRREEKERSKGEARFLFHSFAGYSAKAFPRDLLAGLTLAAIAIPEQMATARLGGFPPEDGFAAFVAAALAFAIFGSSRVLSAGADSTITPIFAGGLLAIAGLGSAHYLGLAAALALIVGGLLIFSGIFRFGWVADLLSIPVTTGFLAGIAIHIIVSQLPDLLGVAGSGGRLFHRLATIGAGLGDINPYSFGLGLLVFAIVLGSERMSSLIPGALIGVAVATASVLFFGLESKGVAVLGAIRSQTTHSIFHFELPAVDFGDLMRAAPLALIVTLVVMVQTAATVRSFSDNPDEPPAVDRDFVGIGTANILAGFFGAFPVDASPPRTAIVVETGGRSQATSLVAAALVSGLVLFGTGLLIHVPHAALAGILVFIASRLFRWQEIIAIYRRAFGEFVLFVTTAVSIVALPIEIGVASGIVLSLLHGMWTTTRTRVIRFEKVRGSTVWWPANPNLEGETIPGLMVIGFQAPLSFFNAYDFRAGVLELIDESKEPLELIVLEASSIVEIDYTAAKIFAVVVRHCQSSGATFAVARLESIRAQEALVRFGIMALIGEDHLFHSVEEAVRTLRRKSS